MIDGSHLIAVVKHTPELLNLDDVRRAGRTIETFTDLLYGLQSTRRVGDDTVLTFTVSNDTFKSVMYYAYGSDD